MHSIAHCEQAYSECYRADIVQPASCGSARRPASLGCTDAYRFACRHLDGPRVDKRPQAEFPTVDFPGFRLLHVPAICARSGACDSKRSTIVGAYARRLPILPWASRPETDPFGAGRRRSRYPPRRLAGVARRVAPARLDECGYIVGIVSDGCPDLNEPRSAPGPAPAL